jgi:CRP/FNR family transcriptional regulator
MFERRERTKSLDLPMSRNDIADYLGLTVETVCRTLSTLRRDRVISVPNPHRIELLDRATLEEIGEAQ